jgi:HD-GYP domain-containing protein (c-di-GMP phosphodiesterase class II)
MLFILIISLEILLNLFSWKNQVATYTFYLGPVLLIGSIFDTPRLLAVPSIHGHNVLFQFGLKNNIWFRLFSQYFFTLGLLIGAVLFWGKNKFKRLNPFVHLGMVFSLSVVLTAAFFYFIKLFPQQGSRFLIFFNGFAIFAPVILMFLVARYLDRYVLKKGLILYSADKIELGKRAFLNGMYLLVLSHLFFWIASSPKDWDSLLGYIFKLMALWFLMVSFWRVWMTRSLLHINYTVKSLMQDIEAHETFTGGHSKRVAVFARIIGKCYGMSHKNLNRLGLAATLHDTGKLRIPKEILQKKEPLNESEWAILRSHPQEGAKLITSLRLSWCERAIVQHHERPDGTGYPGRLSGVESIDLFARIIAVADTFDAITSDRHYRFAGNYAQAQEIILRESGKQFDPKCVNAFMKAFPELIEWKKSKSKLSK